MPLSRRPRAIPRANPRHCVRVQRSSPVTMATSSTASLPYHEPGIVTILIQSSFFVLLNVVNVILDNTVYCGLLGQIFIGVAWGTPGAQWLAESTEEVIVQLGYLGLILLVYEGALFPSIPSYEMFLTSDRWSLDFLRIPEGKLAALHCRRHHGHQRSHRPFLHSSIPAQRNPAAGLRCRCCVMLNQFGHDLHCSCYERSYQVPSRSRPHQCCHDG